MIRVRSYTTLNDPIAQIAAAEEFCESIQAYAEDTYADAHRGKPPDVSDVHVANVLDTLARLGLRFELDGMEEGEGFFVYKSLGGAFSDCLHGYALRVAEDFEENGILEARKRGPTVFDLITCHAMGTDNMIFVPDYTGVSSAAYLLALHPGKIPS